MNGAADGYALWANILFGWGVVVLILCSGLIVKIIVKIKSASGYKEDSRTWEDFKES